MQIILLLAGLILLLAGSGWFAGAATVGWVCLGLFAFLTFCQLVFVASVKRQLDKL